MFALLLIFICPLQEKCAQYWPTRDERKMSFRDTRFLVALESEDVKFYYTARVLKLQNMNVSRGAGPFRWVHLYGPSMSCGMNFNVLALRKDRGAGILLCLSDR